MWEENSIYPRIETIDAYRKDMNSVVVEKFVNGNFNQAKAILEIKFYNPKKLIVQHLPVKQKEKN